jgi:hypothetical protein
LEPKTILEFIQTDEGIKVNIYPTGTVNVLIGVAETIQMITEETKEDRKSILSDVNKILDILEEKEEETKNE